jgi:predicted DNA-binding antitoxin AbrB/MazE fold protein
MKRVIAATYEDGALKLSEKLPLEDKQEVLVIVVPLTRKEQLSADEQARATRMKEQAEAWLARQPADGVRPPLSLPESRTQELDKAFDAALAAIRARAEQFPAAEIAADVDAALAESRALSADDRARLEAELDAILAQIVTSAPTLIALKNPPSCHPHQPEPPTDLLGRF